MNAECFEKLHVGQSNPVVLWVIPGLRCDDVFAPRIEDRDRLEGAILASEVPRVRRRSPVSVVAFHRKNAHQPVCNGKRPPEEKEWIEKGEDRGVGADAECKREDSSERECRAL